MLHALKAYPFSSSSMRIDVLSCGRAPHASWLLRSFHGTWLASATRVCQGDKKLDKLAMWHMPYGDTTALAGAMLIQNPSNLHPCPSSPHTHSPIKHGACTQNTAHARAEPICCAWTATSDRFSREIITIIIIIICSAASALTEIELVDNKIVRLSTHHKPPHTRFLGEVVYARKACNVCGT
jgi:hypothetical protein